MRVSTRASMNIVLDVLGYMLIACWYNYML